ncbi:MAG: sigma-70 family RNA polymerase sigma factor, partial [Rhodobacteraceae bacterium]|nr:sigma-70 family RNA polymerase sigma factor [Paracoccaceae bacterium]
MKQDETTLVARAQAGDEEAFRQLVIGHSHDLFRLAYRLTGSRENADDVVQEAFLRAYRSLHRFDSKSRFGTWMHRITVNCAMDQLRRTQRESGHRDL